MLKFSGAARTTLASAAERTIHLIVELISLARIASRQDK